MSLLNIIYHSLDKIPLLKVPIKNLNTLRISYYHRVNYKMDKYYLDTGINFETFKKQILYLNSKYKIISLSEAIKKANNGDNLKQYLVITFDDGFSECYNYIFPFLKKNNISATFFLIDNMIDNKDLMWRNKLILIENLITKQKKKEIINNLAEELSVKIDSNLSLLSISNSWEMSKKDKLANFLWNIADIGSLEDYLQKHKPYLSESQIFEMLECKQEIGSHTKTHPYCNKLTKNEIDNEVIDSIKSLSKRFNTKIESFSYPFGKRVSKDLENYIIQNTNIKALLGIKDKFSNKNEPSNWERIGLEYPYNESIAIFYFFPIVNRIKDISNTIKLSLAK